MGGALILACQYFATLPYLALRQIGLLAEQPGAGADQAGGDAADAGVRLPVDALWRAGDGWSWVRQFGTTSLLVYWVHIELVYGRWLWFLKNSLTVPQTIAAALR